MNENKELIARAERMLTYKRFGDWEVAEVFAALVKELKKAEKAARR